LSCLQKTLFCMAVLHTKWCSVKIYDAKLTYKRSVVF
jgi:hypothetical protein